MRRADKRRGSRQALLNAAAALMIERGSIDVSLGDVAARANLNSALVRYYFGSKQGLFYELVLDLVQAALGQAQGLIAMDISPVDKLKIHLRGIIRFHFRYPFIDRLIHAMLDDPEQAKKLAEKITIPLAQLQREILQEGGGDGLFRPVNPMWFYFMIAGACDQIFVARNMLNFGFDLPDINEDVQRSYADEVIDIILNGVRMPHDAAAPHHASRDRNAL